MKLTHNPHNTLGKGFSERGANGGNDEYFTTPEVAMECMDEFLAHIKRRRLAVVCSSSHQLVLVSGLMHCPIASVVLLDLNRKTHALSKRTSTTSKFLLVLSFLATRLWVCCS